MFLRRPAFVLVLLAAVSLCGACTPSMADDVSDPGAGPGGQAIEAQAITPAEQARPPEASQKPYEPEVGQGGKDVIWVPTADTLVEKMLDIARVSPSDYLIDLGSGDGRTVIAAAKRGVRAHGIEYNPEMVELSKWNADAAGVSGMASFEKADLFETDLTKATVMTMFLLPSINMELRPSLLKLKPGTRIVSNTFKMEDWEPDESAKVEEGCVNYCTALLWIVPARVEGGWELANGVLRLTQTFQMVSGELIRDDGARVAAKGRLRGDRVTLAAGRAGYEARVDGNTMEGIVTVGGKKQPFKANRLGGPAH